MDDKYKDIIERRVEVEIQVNGVLHDFNDNCRAIEAHQFVHCGALVLEEV